MSVTRIWQEAELDAVTNDVAVLDLADGPAKELILDIGNFSYSNDRRLALFEADGVLITTDDEDGEHLPDNAVQCSVCRRNTQ